VSEDEEDSVDSGSAPKRKKPERKPFLLRLPPPLMEELRIWASNDLRSLNAHIEFLLRQAVKRRKNEDEEN
jgi:hypothetical protein